jgi:hypothetical protein
VDNIQEESSGEECGQEVGVVEEVDGEDEELEACEETKATQRNHKGRERTRD